MWKLESDEDFFRIYDSEKLVAGYFDPDYGEIFPKDNTEEIIASMLKNHEKISGGIVMVPLVKFKLFDRELDTSLTNVEEQVKRVNEHLQKWKNFLSSTNRESHSIRISHTDQDMLTITFPVYFSQPTPLEKNSLMEELVDILEKLKNSDLL
ncbi:hypothetical protein [Nitrosopumilus sp.]|uniref:hypothetical protein n=1 Tax=Nitrosopumilus sp. TaxID=2024843 RepID=UPI0026058911|nr:hypothetical protein [Nitrosopumilus sp.]